MFFQSFDQQTVHHHVDVLSHKTSFRRVALAAEMVDDLDVGEHRLDAQHGVRRKAPREHRAGRAVVGARVDDGPVGQAAAGGKER